MKIFPSNNYKFKLIDNDKETIQRLNRRTEITENLVSKTTDKSFIGKINGNEFNLIGSGYGTLCVLSGKIENGYGRVSVEINKPFKIFFSIFYLMPIISFVIQCWKIPEDFLIFFGGCILQILMIRFMFIELFLYRRFYKQSLNRLTDVLDTEWIKKN